MIVNHRLIYIQMQKTGCTSIEKILENLVDAKPQGPKHGRLTFDPGDRLVFGSVRNPWSWYVSLWAYGCKPAGNLRLRMTRPLPRGWSKSRMLLTEVPRRVLSGKRPLPPDLRRDPELWSGFYSDVEDVQLFRRWVRAVLEAPTKDHLPENYPDSGLARFAGLMTYRFVWANSQWRQWDMHHRRIRSLPELRDFWNEHRAIQACVRTENLESELHTTLRKAGYEIDLSAVTTGKPFNASRHRDWREYYDNQTAALVAERDAFIVHTFSYGRPT